MSTNNQHAARLREIAAYACWVSPEYDEALLAGAEALEAVEVAKAALQAEVWKIGNGTPRIDGNSCYRILSGDQHAVASAYKAALARLEGK
jgi:hypothetical protein